MHDVKQLNTVELTAIYIASRNIRRCFHPVVNQSAYTHTDGSIGRLQGSVGTNNTVQREKLPIAVNMANAGLGSQ
jgi:hypothetical protein